MRLPPLRAGIYQHYKGHHYQVLGYAHDANAEDLLTDQGYDGKGSDDCPHEALGERMVVVYIGLELSDAQRGPRMAVRTVEDFLAYVHPSDGSRVPEGIAEASRGSLRYVEDQGYVPRFRYLGPSYE